VLGASFHYSDLAAVLAADPSAAHDAEVWDRLTEFVERDPAVAGGFRFRHALIRDAAYEGLSFRRRRELHGRVGEMLLERHAADPDEVAELLSLHFSLAGRAAETWRYASDAAVRARAKWANREAVELWMRALEVADEVPDLDPLERSRTWEDVADSLRVLGDYEDADLALDEARKFAPETGPDAVRLMGKEGMLARWRGNLAASVEWYERALTAAEGLDAELRLRNRLDLGMGYAQTRFRQGLFDETISRCNALVEESLAADDIKTLAYAYQLLHGTHTMLGSPERDAFSGLALPLYEQLGDLVGQAGVLNNLGVEAYYAGDWPKALDLYDRSVTFYERVGNVVSVADTRNNIGEIFSDQGRLDEARTLFEDIVASSKQTGQQEQEALARSNLGYVEARAGNLDEAAEILTAAAEQFAELGATSFVLETKARIAEVAALRGDGTQALALADELLGDEGEASEMATLQSTAHRVRAVALAQLKQFDDAGKAIDQSIAIAREAGAAFQLALALDVLAAVDGDRDAASESAQLLAQLGVGRVPRPPLPT
jgi:tetratricopeptide (TPR) repeat protein